MNDKMIISYYKQGFSIDYITKEYYRYKNRHQKPVLLNGVTLFPAKIFSVNDCRLYVVGVIYEFWIYVKFLDTFFYEFI